MAEAITNEIASENGVSVEAKSAGTIGGKDLNPMAVEVMLEMGVSMEGQAPKLLTAELIEWADRVITMGCGVDADACPAGFMITEDWGLDDPAGQDIEAVRRIRDQIRERVLTIFDDEEIR
jgi:arsenate reductase (thioredoxin)